MARSQLDLFIHPYFQFQSIDIGVYIHIAAIEKVSFPSVRCSGLMEKKENDFSQTNQIELNYAKHI